MANRHIIAIGASAGGLGVLLEMARNLPKGFPATLFVACHVQPTAKSMLPDLLSRAGPLLASHAVDGEPFHPSHIYVAPPDHHLLLEPGKVKLNRGPRENHHRPAIDVLFRSAARYYGASVIGVVLTGGQHDGSAGLLAIRSAGGIAVVQDPSDALASSMPMNAAMIAGADRLVSSHELASVLVELVQEPAPGQKGATPVDPIERMPERVRNVVDEQIHNQRGGQLAMFSCPDCGGSLWQVDRTSLTQFRCHVGHVYNGEALFGEQREKLEAALWTAVRTFREQVVLGRQLAAQERLRGHRETAARFEEQAMLAEQYADLIIKNVLEGNGSDRKPKAQS